MIGKSSPWIEADIEKLRDGYARSLPSAELAGLLGRSRAAIRNKAYGLAITNRDDGWSEADIERLRIAYAGSKAKGELDLHGISSSLGRSHTAVCTKARKLGLTTYFRGGVKKPKIDRRKFRTDEERSLALSERMKLRHAAVPHPMLGKKHSEETRKRLSEISIASRAAMTAEQKSEYVMKAMKTKAERYGSLAPPRPNASWKAGWREIGGKRNYYRSRWEANYARYLEWLKCQGEIIEWEHEPETFWFEAIKRGVRSYLPDFRVWEKNGTTPLHEVKGWMDARSKTTLARMGRYHPQETIIVIREREYKAIARQVSRLIEGWETSDRKDRL